LWVAQVLQPLVLELLTNFSLALKANADISLSILLPWHLGQLTAEERLITSSSKFSPQPAQWYS
jgi:hypothetical protein